MVRIGERAPVFRAPALVEGTLHYIESRTFSGQWVVLCFVPSLRPLEAMFLNQQCASEAMAQKGTSVLAVGPDPGFLHRSWIPHLGDLRIVLLADPLQRLHRSYDVAIRNGMPRCCSFVIDPDGVLRFRLEHDLTPRGVSWLAESLTASPARAVRPSSSLPTLPKESGYAEKHSHQ